MTPLLPAQARQIFGGNAYTRNGLGERAGSTAQRHAAAQPNKRSPPRRELFAEAERLYRDVGAYAIPGGSEEILLDLAIRQARPKKSQRDCLASRRGVAAPRCQGNKSKL